MHEVEYYLLDISSSCRFHSEIIEASALMEKKNDQVP